METYKIKKNIMDEVDKKSKILLTLFFLLIIGSIMFTYWKIVVERDYVIAAQSVCDPYMENCFVHICDPSNPDIDGECTGDPVEDTWYTKNMKRMAYNFPACDPVDENCTALICDEGEKDCSYELCDETNVPDGDTCNDPVEYTKNNPIEDEAVEIEDGTESEAAPCDVTVDPACETVELTGEEAAPGEILIDDVPVVPVIAPDNNAVAPVDCNVSDSQSCSIPVVPSVAKE